MADKEKSVWDKTKNAAKQGANAVSDTFDVIGDAASNTAKRVTGEPHTSMEAAVEKVD